MNKDYNDNYFYDAHKSSDFEKLKLSEQLTFKQEMIETLFGKNALKIIENPKPKNYRHKAVLSATNIRVGNNFQIRLGLFEEGTKDIKPKNSHFLHDKEIDDVFKTIEQLLIKYKFKAYHDRSNDGIIKHVMIRKSYSYSTFMVVFSTFGNTFPNHKDFTRELVTLHPNIITIIQNIHRKPSKFVLLEEERILYGNGYITDKIHDLEFQISSRAFYQINPVQMITLYDEAIKLADLKPTDLVLDAYSGIGTLTLLAAKYSKHVYGLEINEASVKDAINNKKLNNISNATFVLGDVENTIEEFKDTIDCLIMDPTREGASLKFIQTIMKLKPKKIVYISCDPRTQARDYKQMGRLYKISAIQPVDMFSYTAHVENVVLLELK